VFQKLVSHNPDIGRLIDKGYALAVDTTTHLVVRDIPYLDAQKQLKIGSIVAKMTSADNVVFQQTDHQVFFAGDMPHGLDGNPMVHLGGGGASITLSADAKDVVVRRSFSYKYKEAGVMRAYKDFEEKIDAYVGQICTPAMELFGVTPFTHRAVQSFTPDPIFKFQDTHTSRADLTELAEKLSGDVVAIIGAGGTGSYILDFLSKCRVKEIRIFDLDEYHVHNAFRSPGSVNEGEFGKAKVEVLANRYSSFRHGVVPVRKYVDSDCAADFEGVTFAFVSVDKGSSRSQIFDLLIKQKIPFIDVGMGLKKKNGSLRGMIRATYYSVEQAEAVRELGLAEMADGEENLYRTNIQIGELNALNACLAVMKFKKIRGFYGELEDFYNVFFDVSDMKSTFLPERKDEDSTPDA